jgi:hypothetical protein
MAILTICMVGECCLFLVGNNIVCSIRVFACTLDQFKLYFFFIKSPTTHLIYMFAQNYKIKDMTVK